MTNHEKLSETAKAIITEEGDWWGTRLLNQLVQEGCSAIKETKLEMEHELGLTCLSIFDFLQWMPQQLTAVQQMIGQCEQVSKELNGDNTGQGKEQIVSEILARSDALVEWYRNAYVWMRTIETTPVDSRCVSALRALAQCAEPITDSIDEFAYAMYEATEDNDYELRKGHSRRAKFEITPALFFGRFAELEQEIKPVMAILAQHAGPPS